MIESASHDPGAPPPARWSFAALVGSGAPQISARSLAWLFAVALVFHCLGNWALPLIDRDEPRFAEASREMFEGGDYVIPYFNGKERFDKPALIYWLQCGAFRVFGINEFAARFPSAVCAALIAVIIAAWSARLFDAATGWRAAVIFSTCLQVYVHARAAVADMAMVSCVALAAWAGWEWHRAAANGAVERREWKHAIIFGSALGLGFLAKGPIALLPLGMVWWSGLAGVQSPRRHALQWTAALLVASAVISSWGVPALIRTHGEFAAVGLGKHVIERSIDPMEGHGAAGWRYVAFLPMYFVAIWATFFPWSIWLPSTLRLSLRHAATRGSIDRYLLVGIGLCFGIFTLVSTKLPHYTLPVFPFIAMLVARTWGEAGRTLDRFQRTARLSVICGLALFLVAFPLAAPQFAETVLYRKAAPQLRPEMKLATVDHNEPSLVWLFRAKIKGYHRHLKEREVEDWLHEPGPRVLVLSENGAKKMAGHFDPSWPIFHAEGLHPVKGRRVRLAAVVKP